MTEEMMPITLTDQIRSARATQKEERERDQALAMREYEAEKLAVRANMERLRALRLAKEAANMQRRKDEKPRKKIADPQS
jgi:hypothetical protein